MASLKGDFEFETENYGRAGLAVNNESMLSYLQSKTGEKSFKTKAEIILVAIGANDAVWTPDMSDFEEIFQNLLEAFYKPSGEPRLIVMLPPRLLGAERL